MIITQLPNSAPQPFFTGNASKVVSNTLPEFRATVLNDTCICDFVQCVYEEKVFASAASTDFWKNDKNDFLFRKFQATDVITLELFKDGVNVASITDNTYGTFFNGFPNGTAEQQLYLGFLIDWRLVFLAFGGGKYYLQSNILVIGNAQSTQSRNFILQGYSDIAADQTVRIETVQNGNIRGSLFDFTDLNWQQSIRIPGVFGNPTPVYETDRYITSTHQRRQNKDTMSREWFLQTKKLNIEVVDKLIYNKLLANEILITDYKIRAESIWRRIPVFPTEIEKPVISGHPDKIYNVTFVDAEDIFVKRNF